MATTGKHHARHERGHTRRGNDIGALEQFLMEKSQNKKECFILVVIYTWFLIGHIPCHNS